ncbi:MAG TPA: hypothetical protein VGM77_01280 [Gemmatimonadales bacterium]|jgi:hypothetical protein
MRIRTALLAALAAAAVAGCHKGRNTKQADLQAVFPTLPLPPGGELLTKEAGTDAVRLILVTPVGPDSVAAYYRNTLSNDPFHLVNDRVAGKTTSLYAEREDNSPSLWVVVSPNGTDGSQVVLAAGAAAVASKPVSTAKP